MCVYQPFPRPDVLDVPDEPGTNTNKTNKHSLTSIQISLPLSRPSITLEIAARADGLSLKFNEPHFVAVTLDGARRGQRWDFRPRLPLVIAR